jgi:tetraacyldisaccharide 4'-kinase
VATPASLRGTRVGLLAGIASPASFRRTLETLGAEVVAERVFPDHHRYHARDVAHLAGASLWITTEKDAAKILPRWVAGAELKVLAIELEVDEAGAFVDWLERTLRARRRLAQ